MKGERGFTFPYELAPVGEPGFDGIPGLKGEQGNFTNEIVVADSF